MDEEGGNEEEDDDDVSGDSGDEVATGTGAGSFDDDESVLSDDFFVDHYDELNLPA